MYLWQRYLYDSYLDFLHADKFISGLLPFIGADKEYQ